MKYYFVFFFLFISIGVSPATLPAGSHETLTLIASEEAMVSVLGQEYRLNEYSAKDVSLLVPWVPSFKVSTIDQLVDSEVVVRVSGWWYPYAATLLAVVLLVTLGLLWMWLVRRA